jgi:NAD(P)-dependent dehydrogenase (short-subunit alcohol dehydrogenase family)
MGCLAGKVAVVTGATSGFGEAIARLFAAEGAALVLGGRRADAGEALAGELGARPLLGGAAGGVRPRLPHERARRLALRPPRRTAQAALFLASDESAYCTGASLGADSGALIR